MIRLNAGFRAGLEWWHTFVGAWNGVSMMRREEVLSPDIHIWSDASGTWGCGALWETHWVQVAWSSYRRHPGSSTSPNAFSTTNMWLMKPGVHSGYFCATAAVYLEKHWTQVIMLVIGLFFAWATSKPGRTTSFSVSVSCAPLSNDVLGRNSPRSTNSHLISLSCVLLEIDPRPSPSHTLVGHSPGRESSGLPLRTTSASPPLLPTFCCPPCRLCESPHPRTSVSPSILTHLGQYPGTLQCIHNIVPQEPIVMPPPAIMLPRSSPPRGCLSCWGPLHLLPWSLQYDLLCHTRAV